MKIIECPIQPEEKRQFQLREVTFTVEPMLAPEVAGRIEDAKYLASAATVVEAFDQSIREALIEDDLPRYQALREGRPPLTFREMALVANHILELETDFPTELPLPSTNGDAATAPSSTVRSRSRAATPVA